MPTPTPPLIRPPDKVKQLRYKLTILSAVIPINELCDRIGCRPYTFKQFIHGEPLPRGWNVDDRTQQAIEIWRNYYQRKTFSSDHTPEEFRRAYNYIGQAIDPMLIKVNDAGRIHGHVGRQRLTDRIHDYLNGYLIRGEQTTYLAICEHFGSKAFADHNGVAVNHMTTRQAIRRVIGKTPALAATVIKAKPGRKEGERVFAGKVHKPGSPALLAAKHLNR